MARLAARSKANVDRPAWWPDAEAQLEILCEQFTVPKPGLLPCSTSGSWYVPSERTIYISVTLGHRERVEEHVTHEFAHYLDRHRNAPRYRTKAQGSYTIRTAWVSHDPTFWRTLRDVATAWYGDASVYPWAHEYRSGQAWAKRMGLLVVDRERRLLEIRRKLLNAHALEFRLQNQVAYLETAPRHVFSGFLGPSRQAVELVARLDRTRKRITDLTAEYEKVKITT